MEDHARQTSRLDWTYDPGSSFCPCYPFGTRSSALESRKGRSLRFSCIRRCKERTLGGSRRFPHWSHHRIRQISCRSTCPRPIPILMTCSLEDGRRTSWLMLRVNTDIPRAQTVSWVFSLLNGIYSRFFFRFQSILAHVLTSPPHPSDDLDRRHSSLAYWNRCMGLSKRFRGSFQTLPCSISMVGKSCRRLYSLLTLVLQGEPLAGAHHVLATH